MNENVERLAPKARREVLSQFEQGSTNFCALLKELSTLITALIHKYAIPASDREDAWQDCAIALISCVRTYDASKGSFGAHAYVTIQHTIVDRIRRELGRFGHKEQSHYDELARDVLENIPDAKAADPCGELEAKEVLSLLEHRLPAIEFAIVCDSLLGSSLRELSRQYRLPRTDVLRILWGARQLVFKCQNGGEAS